MRAVHLEVVPELHTDSCLKQIMGFIARRGKSSSINSDTGTKFVGVERTFSIILRYGTRKGSKNI